MNLPHMRILRKGLSIVPTQDPPGCRVYNESNGEEYQFGAVEQFLLRQLQRPYRIDDICTACNAEFKLSYTSEDIEKFIELLASWDLLEEEDAARPGTEPGTDATEQADEAAANDSYLWRPNRWHLFNPEKRLDGMNERLQSLHFMVWFVPVLFGIGCITVMHNLQPFLTSISGSTSDYGFFGKLLVTTFTVNVVSQIARGLVARYHGLGTPSLGIWLELGLIPRFNLQVVPKGRLNRRTRLWLSATPTLVRLSLFGVGVLLWTLAQSTKTLSMIGVEMAFISFVGLGFSANPLWRGDGVNFLSALLDVPDLRERSHRAFWRLFVKQPTVIVRHARHPLAMAAFGVLSISFLLAIFSYIAYNVFDALETKYRGAGVALFLILSIYVSYSIRRVAQAKKARTGAVPVAAQENSLKNQATRPRATAEVGGSPHKLAGLSVGHRRERWLKYGLLAALIIVLFLPYRYETGGEAEVFPAARVTLATEMDGIVDAVFYKGGEWVEGGTRLAQFSDYKQLKDLRATEASITSTKCDIEKLRTTPSAEEIKLAEAEIETARLRSTYSQDELNRMKPLFESGRISVQDYQDAQKTADADRQQLAEACANLAAVKAQINPNQIASSEADLEKLQHEADFYREQLRRTALLTPISGKIVTKNLDFLLNSYLKAGETFAEIEDTRTVSIQTSVPEFDIRDVSIGTRVRLRLWAYPNREFIGKVDAIQPAAEDGSNGRIVIVTTRMDNPDGALISGLTGQAKILGETTPLLFAYSRALLRFLRIEVWSWLP